MAANGPSPIHPDRIRALNSHPHNPAGQYVLYWMSNSVRTIENAALEHAAYLSNKHDKPLRVTYVIDTTAQDGQPLPERHAAFLLEGLVDVQDEMRKRNVPFAAIAEGNDLPETIASFARNATVVVTDTAYLTPGISTRKGVSQEIEVPLLAVEADVVVPVEVVSTKAEHAARTIRPKIKNNMDEYIVSIPEVSLKHQTECDIDDWISATDASLKVVDLSNIDEALLSMQGLDRGAPRVRALVGGQKRAQSFLKTFLKEKLSAYGNGRNEPSRQLQSDMSPYLRAGNISPVDITLQTKEMTQGKSTLRESEASFLEELIVRRELAVNMCWFNPGVYDIFDEIVPNFAKVSLALHKEDKRPKTYSYEELEAAVTGDIYWNAAQLEMVVRGKMHGYMRMYWVKQIIGWVDDPAQAMDFALRLNNRWELDAVDPNSYAGVIWCFGLHDQGWRERPIWGKVRYMNDAGLKRKFNMAAYIAMVDRMVEKDGLPSHIAALRKANGKGGRQTTIHHALKRSQSSMSQGRAKAAKRGTGGAPKKKARA